VRTIHLRLAIVRDTCHLADIRCLHPSQFRAAPLVIPSRIPRHSEPHPLSFRAPPLSFRAPPLSFRAASLSIQVAPLVISSRTPRHSESHPSSFQAHPLSFRAKGEESQPLPRPRSPPWLTAGVGTTEPVCAAVKFETRGGAVTKLGNARYFNTDSPRTRRKDPRYSVFPADPAARIGCVNATCAASVRAAATSPRRSRAARARRAR
jgi:hypothetical protein